MKKVLATLVKLLSNPSVSFSISKIELAKKLVERHAIKVIATTLTAISIYYFYHYYQNGLGLSYNDARSHLDIGRRVVEGLKPGIAQIGSVWLPLPHLLMVPTIWNDFMWHSGLSGALQSMISFVATGVLIYLFLKELGAGMLARFFGVILFVANVNILYLQSTAMTELLLIATTMAGCYYLYIWQKYKNTLHLVKASFFIMLSTLVRYDGWFLVLFASALIALVTFAKGKYQKTEGTLIMFGTLAGFGIVLWFLWNLIIFNDPLYFIFGPFSAHTQQEQLNEAGVLVTDGNWALSAQVYLYALFYNSYVSVVILGLFGAIALVTHKVLSWKERIMSLALVSPFIFNILALYLGHSVLLIQGISGNTWFNVRYGIMVAPSLAVYGGYLIHRLPKIKWAIIGVTCMALTFGYLNTDAVTIDDARVGSSQKNVSEVSGWLAENAKDKEGFILISAASHDAIIFSSGLPMMKFIHEGTGAYWESATTAPDRWARWIVMRTYDNNDLTFRLVNPTGALEKYTLVNSYPFADIYELKAEYVPYLQTKPVYKGQ